MAVILKGVLKSHFTHFRVTAKDMADKLTSTKKVNLIPHKTDQDLECDYLNDFNKTSEFEPVLFKSKFNSTKNLDISYDTKDSVDDNQNSMFNSLQNYSKFDTNNNDVEDQLEKMDNEISNETQSFNSPKNKILTQQEQPLLTLADEEQFTSPQVKQKKPITSSERFKITSNDLDNLNLVIKDEPERNSFEK